MIQLRDTLLFDSEFFPPVPPQAWWRRDFLPACILEAVPDKFSYDALLGDSASTYLSVVASCAVHSFHFRDTRGLHEGLGCAWHINKDVIYRRHWALKSSHIFGFENPISHSTASHRCFPVLLFKWPYLNSFQIIVQRRNLQFNVAKRWRFIMNLWNNSLSSHIV